MVWHHCGVAPQGQLLAQHGHVLLTRFSSWKKVVKNRLHFADERTSRALGYVHKAKRCVRCGGRQASGARVEVLTCVGSSCELMIPHRARSSQLVACVGACMHVKVVCAPTPLPNTVGVSSRGNMTCSSCACMLAFKLRSCCPCGQGHATPLASSCN